MKRWHFIHRLNPYVALALLAVPIAIVEPLKLVGLFIFGKGHWITGSVMVLFAYAGSLLVVERLFTVVKPKLIALFRGYLEMVDVSFTKNQTMVAIEVSKIQKRSPVFMAAESNGKSIT
jgi:hypothetical protein